MNLKGTLDDRFTVNLERRRHTPEFKTVYKQKDLYLRTFTNPPATFVMQQIGSIVDEWSLNPKAGTALSKEK